VICFELRWPPAICFCSSLTVTSSSSKGGTVTAGAAGEGLAVRECAESGERATADESPAVHGSLLGAVESILVDSFRNELARRGLPKRTDDRSLSDSG
jgi:hypothetical protein